jgi:hypothetical protein
VVLDEMKVYDTDLNVDQTSDVYREKVTFFEEMVKIHVEQLLIIILKECNNYWI